MKLAIGGATGFVGTEILRQALRNPAITVVLAITRRSISVPTGVDEAKLRTLVVEDFTNYPEEAKKQLAEVDAFIWTIAIPPSKASSFEWEEVYRVCHDYTIAALKAAVAHRSPSQPLRFVMYSGIAAERDQTKTPARLPQYCLMRGQIENETLQYATESQGLVEVCVAKPGLITSPDRPPSAAAQAAGLPSITVEACAAATIQPCVEGIEKDTLLHDDLVRIGTAYLEKSTT